MKLKDMFKFSVDNLSHRGLRSWLTILGIVIGVAAVLSILSLGEGMEQEMTEVWGVEYTGNYCQSWKYQCNEYARFW